MRPITLLPAPCQSFEKKSHEAIVLMVAGLQEAPQNTQQFVETEVLKSIFQLALCWKRCCK
jgi:hypothetical protein